jgi:hypothetical protein
MRNEVEEFLKRVARMRAEAEAQARGGQQRPLAPQPAAPIAPAPQPATVFAPPAQNLAYPSPIEAEVVDAELAETSDAVARHVTQHLRGTEEIAEHTRQLGADVDLADDKLEAHLHQVFDHQLGRLKTTATDQAAAAASDVKRTGFTAGSIAGMLLSPDSIRNAIVLGEILRRPDEGI